ncbi:MAG: hypothetical protein ACUVX9_16225 [Anaerolineae bacterium]
MLDEAGRIEFVEELLDLMEPLLRGYECRQGQTLSQEERLGALAYGLGILRQDVDTLLAMATQDGALKGVDVDRMLREALGGGADRADTVRQALQRRGWLT